MALNIFPKKACLAMASNIFQKEFALSCHGLH
jgi:hypothetical protein